MNKDKNGNVINVGDIITHVANPLIKGKITKCSPESPSHYLKSSWIEVIFESPVVFSGNPGRISKYWLCSASLLEKQ